MDQEQILTKILELQQKTMELLNEARNIKWDMDNVIRQIESFNKFINKNEKEINEKIESIIFKNTTQEKMQKIITVYVVQYCKEHLNDSWSMRSYVEDLIRNKTESTAKKILEDENIIKQLHKIIKGNLVDAVESELQRFASTAVEKTTASKLIKLFKKDVNDLPEKILREFKWKLQTIN